MSKKQQSWHFPKNGGGLAAGFNDSSIDTFKGRRLSSLVRETIQNSVDAKASDTSPVVVHFQIDKLLASGIDAVSSLVGHIRLAKKTAQIQGSSQAVDFYNQAERLIEPSADVSFLCVHDSNTTGLTGPIEGPNGAWYALTKGSGLTQHSRPSLGSFGHGSKAPFVSSGIRSVFYLSIVELDSKIIESRFQGKSILQSYEIEESGEMTQGTGFYGNPNKCLPLIDSQIPSWAFDLRKKSTDQCGTSLLIPGTIWTVDSLSSIAITAIANFFYAIWKGVLEVQIGDVERLNAENIVSKYKSYKARLGEAFIEIDRELIVDAFQSIETIINPTKHGEQQIQGFGRVDWYLRMDDEIDTRYVAVARGNGMLITRRAPELRRFTNLKPFDFFVCVTGGEGAEVLRSTENPEHTNFEFDRIDDIAKKKHAEKKYNLFQREVRDILGNYAAYSTSDQIIVDDLKDLFNEISEDINTPGGSIERGKKMFIANGNFSLKPKAPDILASASKEGSPNDMMGSGFRDGDKKKQTEGGTIPSDKGKIEIVGASKIEKSDGAPKKVYPLSGIRMRPSNVNPREATIYFEVALSGPASIRVKRAGEISNEPLTVIVNGKKTESFDVQLVKNTRMSLSLLFADSDVDFAIEGEAYEI